MKSRRLLLFLAALFFAAPLFYKGHRPPTQDGRVAFMPFTPQGITIRVTGNVQRPGIYVVPRDAALRDVILLTGIPRPAENFDKTILNTTLRSGDIVAVGDETLQSLAVSLKRMSAAERVILAIPLCPDQMNGEDWRALPGIGPKLAQEIITDRQLNGDFCSIEAVRRVPGMGEKKFLAIKKYFIR